jgi:diguanylate cyclase (GGDEF)-like protein
MKRCRDIIIERSRWICSVLLMSAFGAAIFGAAGADGRGSEWSAVHPKRALVIVVRPHGSANISPHGSASVSPHGSAIHSHVSAPATFGSGAPVTLHSHASPKGRSHQNTKGDGPANESGAQVHVHSTSGYRSSVTTSSSNAGQPTGSGSTPAQQVRQAAPQVTGSRPGSARAPVHASHSASSHHNAGAAPDARFSTRSNDTSPSDSAAVSAALGAWTGASVEVATVPAGCATDTSTTTGDSTIPSTGQPSSTTGAPGTTGQGGSGQITTPPGCGAGQDAGAHGATPGADQGTATGTGTNQGTGTGADQGTGTGAGAQDNNGQSNTVPGTGATDQSGQGATGTGQPAQGATGTGQPAQGATGTGQPGQGDVGQGQGAQGATCPTDLTGTGVGQGGGGDGTAIATPIVGGSSDNGLSDQTAPATSCDQGGGSAAGGPLTSPSPGTGSSDNTSGISTDGSGPLTAVSPGQNGSSATPSLPTPSLPTPITSLPTTGVTQTPGTTRTPGPTQTPGTTTLPKVISPGPTKLSSAGFVPKFQLSPVPGFSGGTGIPLLGSVIGGIGTGAGAGAGGATGAALGTLTPATSQIGVRGAAKAPHKSSHAHARGSTPRISEPLSAVPGAQAIASIVTRIPEWVWIALAGLAVLAIAGFGAAFRSSRRVRRQAGAIAAASAAAMTDPLTGVVNRRGFAEAVERELARARRYHRPFVLAYVDVRGLKTVNDTEGHLAGDELLKGVASLLRDSARADDVVGRIGGDELGLLIVEQSAEGAEVVTHRIQSLLPERRAELGLAAGWGLTIGTAAFPQDGETFSELLETADRRLYEQRGIEIRRA